MAYDIEIAVKIASERYKVYSDKKKQCVDTLKYIAWLTTTLIIINSISIGKGSIGGIIDVEPNFLRGISLVNIFILSVIVIKIAVMIAACSHYVSNNSEKFEHHGDNDEGWFLCLSELEASIIHDSTFINSSCNLSKSSLSWIASSIGVSLIPIFVKDIPAIWAYIKHAVN